MNQLNLLAVLGPESHRKAVPEMKTGYGPEGGGGSGFLKRKLSFVKR